MNTIIIPRLYCPFVSDINPHTDTALQHTNEWVTKFELYSEKVFGKYLEDNTSYLTGRFYPGADREQLCIANDLFALLFIVDDLLDNQLEKAKLIQKEEALLRFIDEVAAITNDNKSYQGDFPVLNALSDIWLRLERISTTAWRDFFAKSLKNLFAAAVWEFHNAGNGKIPDVDQYLRLRQYLGAARVATDLIEPTEQIFLPTHVLEHPSIQSLIELSCNAICISNDLFSLSKEQAHGDAHNLVTVLQQAKGITQEETIVQAAEIHDEQVRKFISLSGQLPAFDKATDAEVQRYIHVLRMQMAGNIAWSSSETKRYAFMYEDDTVMKHT